jgi:hypothetical protein
MVLPILLSVGTIAAGLAAEPWLTLMVIGAIYIGSIPVAYYLTAGARRATPPSDGKAEPKPADAPSTVLSMISGGRGEPR